MHWPFHPSLREFGPQSSSLLSKRTERAGRVRAAHARVTAACYKRSASSIRSHHSTVACQPVCIATETPLSRIYCIKCSRSLQPADYFTILCKLEPTPPTPRTNKHTHALFIQTHTRTPGTPQLSAYLHMPPSTRLCAKAINCVPRARDSLSFFLNDFPRIDRTHFE